MMPRGIITISSDKTLGGSVNKIGGAEECAKGSRSDPCDRQTDDDDPFTPQRQLNEFVNSSKTSFVTSSAALFRRLFRLRNYSPVAAARRPSPTVLSDHHANVALVGLNSLDGRIQLAQCQRQLEKEKPKKKGAQKCAVVATEGKSTEQKKLLLLSIFNVLLTMKQRTVAAVIFGILFAATLLMGMADLLIDVHCDSDGDCSQPRVCRFVCRRNCKSVCVLLASEKQLLPVPNRRQMAAPKRASKKMGHRKANESSTEDFEAPFLAGQNPFVLAKMREEITPLTISEDELEAELGQREEEQREDYGETPKGPSDFVTAPSANNLEEAMSGTTAKQLTTASSSLASLSTHVEMRNFHGTMTSKKAGKITEVRGRGRSPSPPRPMTLTMSTSMELLQKQQGEEKEEEEKGTTAKMRKVSRQTADTTTAKAKVPTTATAQTEEREPPGISPQPPGFSPIATSSSSTTTTPTAKMERTSKGLAGEEEEREGEEEEENGEEKSEREEEKREREGKKSGRKKGDEEEKRDGGKETKYWPPLKLTTAKSQKRISETTATTEQRESTDTTQRTTKRNCPNPPVCLRNCGIFIDEDGCQSCQCLWISKACDTDLDCAFTEGQFCDLGRCECAEGWEQDIAMSGICRFKESAKLRGVPNVPGPDQSAQLSTATSASSDQLAFSLSTYPTTLFFDSDIFSPSILGTFNGQLKLPFHHRLFVPNLGPKLRKKRQMIAAEKAEVPNFSTALPMPIVPINQPPKQTLLFPHFFDDITAQEKNVSIETPVDYDDSDEGEENNLKRSDETATPKQMPTMEMTTMAQRQMMEVPTTEMPTIVVPKMEVPTIEQMAPMAVTTTEKLTISLPNKAQIPTVEVPTTALIQTVHTLHFATEEQSQIDQRREEEQREEQEEQQQDIDEELQKEGKRTETTKTAHLIVPKTEEEQNEEEKGQQKQQIEEPNAEEAAEQSDGQLGQQAVPATQPPVEKETAQPKVREEQQQYEQKAQTETISLVKALQKPPKTLAQEKTTTETETEPQQRQAVRSPSEEATKAPINGQESMHQSSTEKEVPLPSGDHAAHPPSATPPFRAVRPPSATPPMHTKSKHFRALRPFSIPQHKQQKKGLQKIQSQEDPPADDVRLGLTALRGTDLRHHPLRQTLPWEEPRHKEAIFPMALSPPPNKPTIGTIGRTEEMAQIVGEVQESDNGVDETHGKRIYLDYTRQNRISRPIRVEHKNSKELIKDECVQSRDCGRRQFLCCAKRWCDLGGECGMAKFCLPSCEMTKLAHLSELSPEGMPRIDLLYD